MANDWYPKQAVIKKRKYKLIQCATKILKNIQLYFLR